MRKAIGMGPIRFHSPYSDRLREEGREEGREEEAVQQLRARILDVLHARGIAVGAEQQQRVAASADRDELERWLGRTWTAETADEIFS